ncbi:MAG: FHA domain-containing protein [Anaerolineae bacterium]|nr:FHA domain-containing protein [Anaerolineae bacterium]
MQQCPNCGYSNRPGVILCDNCGASLIGKMPIDTKSLESSSEEEKAEIGVDASVLTDVKVQGVSEIGTDDVLKLEIEGGPEPIFVEPKAEAIFGRRDPATGAMPDIDLTPFAGYRMGVSRRHAAIRQNDEQSLDVWDLGSSNGTFLNGQKLSAHRPYRLHDGDELRLGQMMIRVTFQALKPGETLTKQEAVAPKATGPLPPEPEAAPAKEPITGKVTTTDEIKARVPAQTIQPAAPAEKPAAPAAEAPAPAAVAEKLAAAPSPTATPSTETETAPKPAAPTDAAKQPPVEAAKPPAEEVKAEAKPPAEEAKSKDKPSETDKPADEKRD